MPTAVFQRVLHLADDLQCRRGRQFLQRRRGLRRGGQRIHSQARRDTHDEALFDMPQVPDHRFADVRMLDLGKFEYQRRCEVRLLGRALAQIKLPRLAVVIGKPLIVRSTPSRDCRRGLPAKALFAGLSLRHIRAPPIPRRLPA